MPTMLNIGTRDIPLRLAGTVSARANAMWERGDFLEKVTPTTRDLLRFWFCEPHTDGRRFNFHEGQRQAILNTIYLHEILGSTTVQDTYGLIDPELLPEMDAAELAKQKYRIPKYAIKMATGTGKTWVMHALVLWQYLNAKHEESSSRRYSKRFLLVAPGLIVYERLLDAYLGKERDGDRDFESSDMKQFEELFIPPAYAAEVFGFIQTSVAKKDEIGTKATGDGLIAIANWHLFSEGEEEEEAISSAPLDDPSAVVRDLIPLRPGVSAGNDLAALDARYARGRASEYLASLPDLVCINDEAHHIHENKTYGEVAEVEWQKSLNRIAEPKGSRFVQVDFSATPYDVTGSGKNRTKHYFPHVIVDFDLRTAIRKGLVKMIAIDKRVELTELGLDFKAVREGKEVVGLSDGQKLMLRAGLKKLRIIEESFSALSAGQKTLPIKYPKMLVVCEDTAVTPFVERFLIEEGLGESDVMRIDSNRKGEVPAEEWLTIKRRLFDVDRHATPKVIVSVLMLREGFDVSNICVVVPLRSSEAPILLEQVIGRGLRLMWREPDFREVKDENRKRLLSEKESPLNYLDLLSIVEHPAFMAFYDDLLKEGLAAELDGDPKGKEGVLGDIVSVGLKADYRKYDLFWPIVLRESEEELHSGDIEIGDLKPFAAFTLDSLKEAVGTGEKFVSEEVTVKTRFGSYVVSADLFTAESYNEYLQKIVAVITNRFAFLTARKQKMFPTMQVNHVGLVGAIDRYIRSVLFSGTFDPFADDNWKVLLLRNSIVTQHIIAQMEQVLFRMQSDISATDAVVEKRWFSEVPDLRVREDYSVPIRKTIYERLPYPSNKGGFEKAFLEYVDSDGGVERFIKINEYYHPFASVLYLRADGLLSVYAPDFLVDTGTKVYVVETKGENASKFDLNVRQKQLAVLDWTKRINALPAEERGSREWVYVLLSESHFYGLRDANASVDELFGLARVKASAVDGKLF